MTGYIISDHPLVQEKLARLRDKTTSPRRFRALMAEVGAILSMEALASMRTHACKVQTPLLKQARTRMLDHSIVGVAILRAGLGMLDGLLRIVPEARIGHIGLYRDEKTLNPVRYYVRLPQKLNKSVVLLCDPMLATGGSAVEALRILKSSGAKRIVLVSLLAAKKGLKRVRHEHPDIPIVLAAVDPMLNRHGYIVPGLGDAGDRLFGTQ